MVLKISSLNTLYGRVTAPQSTSKTWVSSKKSNEGGRHFVTVPRFETYDARYKWLKNRFFIGYAACTSRGMLLTFRGEVVLLGSLACFCRIWHLFVSYFFAIRLTFLIIAILQANLTSSDYHPHLLYAPIIYLKSL